MKKWIAFLLCFVQLWVAATAKDLWSETKEKTVTQGVQYVEETRFTSDGWQNVHILEVDLTNENLELTTLFDSRGISKSKNILKMAEEQGAVAAVNGDFFNWEGTPLGFTVKDGEVISSPSHDPGLAALIETEDGAVFTEYVDMHLVVTCPEGYEAEILHINKYHSMQSMVLYTSDWGEKTPGSHDGISELVAVDGIVREVRQNMDGVKVPENGFVLATSTYTSTYLVDNFKPGDEIQLSYTLKPEMEKIRMAIGGGSVLVKKGKVANFTNIVSGTHPRTAAGVDKKGEKLYLVTVEGRQTNMPGFTQTALAEYMVSLGCDSAINLDGGGSSTMVTRNGETGQLQVVNTPSDGSLRAVSTGIGVRFTGEVGELAILEVKVDGEYGMEGEAAHIYLGAYDAQYNPVYIADKKIEYLSEDGTFEGNVFYPAHAGPCKVTVRCGNVTGVGMIEVLKKPTPFEEEKPGKGASVLILPGKVSEETCMDAFINRALEKKAEEGEMVFAFGKYESENAIPVSRFSAAEQEGSLFVTVNVGSSGSIRKTDASQWENILEICEETTAQNVMFLLSKPLSDFSDNAEAALFKRVITEMLHKRGKDVFVISSGSKNEMEEENGVRYLTVAAKADIRAEKLFADSAEKCGILFTVQGDAVHLEAIPLWERVGK